MLINLDRFENVIVMKKSRIGLCSTTDLDALYRIEQERDINPLPLVKATTKQHAHAKCLN